MPAMTDQDVRWIKSSRSLNNGTSVEVGWVPGCADRQCVEVGHDGDEVLVRDGKNPDGPVLVFTAAEWDAFLAGAKDGEFD